MVLCALLFVGGCWILSSQLCAGPPYVVEEQFSPSGDYHAIACLTSCGATTSWTPYVSLIRSGESITDEQGNLVEKGVVFRGAYGREFLKLTWTDSSHLLIQHDSPAEYEVDCRENPDLKVGVACERIER
jgi:hypothetical protein